MSFISKRSTPTRGPAYETVVVRLARPEDEASIARIAALDGKRPPAGRVLVAEADAEIVAARAVDGDHSVADPFRWTSDLLALMEMRAAQLRAADGAAMPGAGGTVQALRTQAT